MIGISADFDPVHLGHVKLIDKARELADKKNDEVVIYLTRDSVQTTLLSLQTTKQEVKWRWKPVLIGLFL